MTAISDYFRTALLIDDRVDADYRPLEELQTERTEGRSDEPEPGLVPPPTDDETPVHPSDLVRAFLAARVVCSVLEPSGDRSRLQDQALRGAQIADLLILDWLMFGDDSATVDAISAIAEQHAGRLTAIVVFTGAHSLSDVVERLIEAAGFERADDFILRRGSTVLLVFGKPGIPLTGGEDARQPDSYRELPGMIRDDLEIVFKGLMPEFAFRGINALRESAPRILATFSSELDAAALVHRALLPEPSDAASQFVRLLASDFEQALVDNRAGDIWNLESSSDSLARTMRDGNPSKLAKRLRDSQTTPESLRELDDRELARRATANGLSKIGMRDSAASRAIDDLMAAFGPDQTSNESLAVLMSSTSFGEMPPRLELGVVLRGGDGTYWLCIQPQCDSVRMTEERAFPIMPLSLDAHPAAAMVRSPEGQPIRIGFDWSPHKLALPKFVPTSAGAVVAQGDPANWSFTSVDGADYLAVARLRPEIAAQAIHGLASAATRAGADSSEWLRRRAQS